MAYSKALEQDSPRQNIAIVLPDLSAIGAQRYVLGIIKRLGRFNIDYKVLLQYGGGDFIDEVPEHLLKVFEYRIFPHVRGIRAIETFVRLVLLLRRGRYDCIYCISPYLNRVVCFLRLVGLTRARIVIEEHGYPPRYLSPDDGMSASWVFFYRKTFFLYRSATFIRVISRGIFDYYHGIGLRENVVYFPNLIDLARVEQLGAGSLSGVLPKGRNNILYFGRLSAQKNVSFLLEAFAKLVKCSEAHLTIVGSGDEKTKLQELASQLHISDQVTFLGFVPNPYPLIRSADIMALTSIWEGSPQVLVEAMALGTAVVARDCPTGPSEMIGTNSDRGWLVPYDAGAEEFSLAMEEAIQNIELRESRVATAKEFVFQEYDIDGRLEEQINCFF